MTDNDLRWRGRWVQFREYDRNEQEYEIYRRLKQEGNEAVLNKNVRFSQQDIIKMARVVAKTDQDPVRFLHLFRQESKTFDVAPEDVYTEERFEQDKWGYDFSLDETEALRDIICAVHTYCLECPEEPDVNRTEEIQIEDVESVIELLGELCKFFQTAVEIEIPPVLDQG